MQARASAENFSGEAKGKKTKK